MNAMYDIHFDPETAILTARFEGFWTLDTLAAYSAAILAKMDEVRRTVPNFMFLRDGRDFTVQSAEVTEGLVKLMEVAGIKGRTAIITSTMLGKLQTERMYLSSNVRIFQDIDQARTWLISGEEA